MVRTLAFLLFSGLIKKQHPFNALELVICVASLQLLAGTGDKFLHAHFCQVAIGKRGKQFRDISDERHGALRSNRLLKAQQSNLEICNSITDLLPSFFCCQFILCCTIVQCACSTKQLENARLVRTDRECACSTKQLENGQKITVLCSLQLSSAIFKYSINIMY